MLPIKRPRIVQFCDSPTAKKINNYPTKLNVPGSEKLAALKINSIITNRGIVTTRPL